MKYFLIVPVFLFFASADSFGNSGDYFENIILAAGKKDSVITATFSISKLGCKSDAANMEKAILQSKGVKDCTVNAEKGTAVITYNAGKTSEEALKKIIESCGLCHDQSKKPFKVTDVK